MDTNERSDARHRVEKAIAFYESSGKEETLSRIADPKGQFIDGERYIFALDLEGKLLAHPFAKKLAGRNLMDLRDSEGKRFIRKLLAKAKNRGYGFVGYMWPVPNSGDELHKTVFFERADGMVICSGFYSVKRSFLDAMFGGYCGPPYVPL